MNLQNLIDKKDLIKIEDVSINQIKKRFEFAISNFNTVKKLLNSEINRDEEYNEIVYTNIYKSARVLLEIFLLLNEFRVKTKYGRHEMVIKATKLIMNDPEMETVFSRLDRMRKNRNTIDYDIESLDVSEQTLKQAIQDVQKLMDKIDMSIKEKDKQQRLV